MIPKSDKDSIRYKLLLSFTKCKRMQLLCICMKSFATISFSQKLNKDFKELLIAYIIVLDIFQLVMLHAKAI